MKTIEQYYNGFFISLHSANNKLADCSEKLRVAPIKKVSEYEPLNIENKYFSFAEKDSNGNIELFHGLHNFLWIDKPEFPPIFIFDNHNHALFFRYKSIKGKNDIELIHIDQHSDCRDNTNQLSLNNSKDTNDDTIFHFTNELCNVGNFIHPALESGLISSQTQIRTTTALKTLRIEKNQNFILDIDLDFCLNGENRNITDKKKVTLLINKFQEFAPHAKCITIATSPYFLNQEAAIYIIENLLQ